MIEQKYFRLKTVEILITLSIGKDVVLHYFKKLECTKNQMHYWHGTEKMLQSLLVLILNLKF